MVPRWPPGCPKLPKILLECSKVAPRWPGDGVNMARSSNHKARYICTLPLLQKMSETVRDLVTTCSQDGSKMAPGMPEDGPEMGSTSPPVCNNFLKTPKTPF
eukprot:3791315-Karenia_brevis.AAC.1